MAKGKKVVRKGTTKRPLLTDVVKARAAADAVVRRALAEPSYRKLLASNPARAMAAMKVPAIAIEDLSREIVIDGNSLGSTCEVTCMITCLITCAFTGKGRLPGDVVNPGPL